MLSSSLELNPAVGQRAGGRGCWGTGGQPFRVPSPLTEDPALDLLPLHPPLLPPKEPSLKLTCSWAGLGSPSVGGRAPQGWAGCGSQPYPPRIHRMHIRVPRWGSHLAVSSRTQATVQLSLWHQSHCVTTVPRGPQPSPSHVAKAAARSPSPSVSVARLGARAPGSRHSLPLWTLLSEEKLNHFVFLV